MHPVPRLGTFLVFAVCLSWTSPLGLGLAGGVLLIVALITGGAGLAASLRMILRLRWLFLSILIIYLWFTPGQPLFGSNASRWVPSWEGVSAGTLRVAVLVMLVLAANVLLAITPRQQLVGALVWWCGPLRAMGASPERLALRLSLSLEALEALQGQLGHSWQRRAGEGRLGLLGRAAGEMFRYAAERADAPSCQTRQVALLSSPPWRDWVYPAGLGVLFAAVAPL